MFHCDLGFRSFDESEGKSGSVDERAKVRTMRGWTAKSTLGT